MSAPTLLTDPPIAPDLPEASFQSVSAAFAHFIPLVEAEMRSVIRLGLEDDTLGTLLNYHLGFAQVDGTPTAVYSGKRIRPMLVLLSCAAGGGEALQAIPAAAAVELLHNFSLIHDDLEDRDELRHGRPTLWKVWGEAQAINAGDTMFAQAHLSLQRTLERGVAAERVLRALTVFDAMCVQLTIGQHRDLCFERRTDVSAQEYLRMIEGKTAALTKACCEIGAILAGANDTAVEALGDFGQSLGLSFQLQDDVLGIWGDPSKTGKLASDLAHGKKTLPVLFAAEHDGRIREHYFTGNPLSTGDIDAVKGMIEAAGGRAHVEQAAQSAFAHGLEALESVKGNAPAIKLLRELAQSLLGRAN